MARDHQADAAVFKAFCDENRLQILELLRGGEQSATQLLEELRISQPTLSHHMKILCESGIVSWKKAGKWTLYQLDPEGRAAAMALLDLLTTPASPQETASRDESEVSDEESSPFHQEQMPVWLF